MKLSVRIYDVPLNCTPKLSRREVANTDVIVLRHEDRGLWSLWKHHESLPVRAVPFDALPSDVKTLVGRSL